MMSVLAQRGPQFLIDLGSGSGCIYDDDQGTFYPTVSITSLLARGYWDEPDTKLPDDLVTAINADKDS